MAIDLKKAYEIVKEELRHVRRRSEEDCVIIESAVIEKEHYWVFSYNSREYLETGDMSNFLTGNSPFIIDKMQGRIFETGTAYPVEFYLEEFEKEKLPMLLEEEKLL